jgi:hypothetical protein
MLGSPSCGLDAGSAGHALSTTIGPLFVPVDLATFNDIPSASRAFGALMALQMRQDQRCVFSGSDGCLKSFPSRSFEDDRISLRSLR